MPPSSAPWHTLAAVLNPLAATRGPQLLPAAPQKTLTLRKLHIWEVAIWNIVIWEVTLGKMHLHILSILRFFFLELFGPILPFALHQIQYKYIAVLYRMFQFELFLVL